MLVKSLSPQSVAGRTVKTVASVPGFALVRGYLSALDIIFSSNKCQSPCTQLWGSVWEAGYFLTKILGDGCKMAVFEMPKRMGCARNGKMEICGKTHKQVENTKLHSERAVQTCFSVWCNFAHFRFVKNTLVRRYLYVTIHHPYNGQPIGTISILIHTFKYVCHTYQGPKEKQPDSQQEVV